MPGKTNPPVVEQTTTWLTADEVGVLIRKRRGTIMNAVYAGQEGVLIPQSTRLGGRRVWDANVVAAWIEKEKAASTRAAEERRERQQKELE